MRKEEFGLLALESTNVVMKLEKELLREGYSVRVIPVPKEVTANCGLSIKFELEDREAVGALVAANEVSGEFFRIIKEGLKKTVEKF